MGDGYIEAGIVGQCSKCRLDAALQIPEHWPTAKVEQVENRRVIKAFCPKCREVTEFIPAPGSGGNTPGQKLMQDAERKIREEIEKAKAENRIIVPSELRKACSTEIDKALEAAKKIRPDGDGEKIVVVSH